MLIHSISNHSVNLQQSLSSNLSEKDKETDRQSDSSKLALFVAFLIDNKINLDNKFPKLIYLQI